MAAGFPGRSDDLVIPDLPPLVAAAPSSVSTLWVKTLERVSVMDLAEQVEICLLYTSPSPRDLSTSRMPSSA